MAAGSPGRHGSLGQRRGKLNLGVRPTKPSKFPETRAELVPGGEGEVHHGQVQSEGVFGASAGRPVRISQPC